MLKNVLITGASRGIGRATALTFAKDGYTVLVNYLNNEAKANSLCDEIKAFGGRAFPLCFDVSDKKDVHIAVEYAMSKVGHIDTLINNAAISFDGLFTQTSQNDWSRIFAVNVNGTYNCISELLTGMISAKRGCIINVSSIWGLVGASCEVAYSSSKAAIIGLTKALAKEVGPSNIRVNCIAPGIIDTDMNLCYTKSDIQALIDETPLGRIGSADDIASLMLFLASDKASFITGQVISSNGGFVI